VTSKKPIGISLSDTKLNPQAIILAEYWLAAPMDNELLAFLASVGLLILYLVFSALTEMGTKGLAGK
jgi:hypothetical protein